VKFDWLKMKNMKKKDPKTIPTHNTLVSAHALEHVSWLVLDRQAKGWFIEGVFDQTLSHVMVRITQNKVKFT
jgi:hypothetical protein